MSDKDFFSVLGNNIAHIPLQQLLKASEDFYGDYHKKASKDQDKSDYYSDFRRISEQFFPKDSSKVKHPTTVNLDSLYGAIVEYNSETTRILVFDKFKKEDVEVFVDYSVCDNYQVFLKENGNVVFRYLTKYKDIESVTIENGFLIIKNKKYDKDKQIVKFEF